VPGTLVAEPGRLWSSQPSLSPVNGVGPPTHQLVLVQPERVTNEGSPWSRLHRNGAATGAYESSAQMAAVPRTRFAELRTCGYSEGYPRPLLQPGSACRL